VLDLILDKGIVIDAFVRVSLVGIELLTVDLRVVIASVDTYLRYAEGAERLQLYNRSVTKQLPDMVKGGVTAGAVKKGAEEVGDAFDGDDEDDDEDENKGGQKQEQGVGEQLATGVRKVLTCGVGGIMKRLSGDEDDEEIRTADKRVVIARTAASRNTAPRDAAKGAGAKVSRVINRPVPADEQAA
jgi:gas vesicle structural protein